MKLQCHSSVLSIILFISAIVEAGPNQLNFDYSVPDNWQYIPGYEACGLTDKQSPANLVEAEYQIQDSRPDSVVAWKTGPVKVDTRLTLALNNSMNIAIAGETVSSFSYNGEVYEYDSAHFHFDSEHSIGGNKGDIEIHLVHKSSTGRLAVLGVMLKAVPGTPGSSVFVENLRCPSHCSNGYAFSPWKQGGDNGSDIQPMCSTPNRTVTSESDLIDVDKVYKLFGIDSSRLSVLHYEGSLTTPPCSVGVEWFVHEHIVPVNVENIIQAMNCQNWVSNTVVTEDNLTRGNSRPIQRDTNYDKVTFVSSMISNVVGGTFFERTYLNMLGLTKTYLNVFLGAL